MKMSVNQIGRYSILIIIPAIIIYFLFLIKDILTPFILGFMLAYFLWPLVKWLETKNISRLKALLLIFGVLLLIISITSVTIIPLIIKELQNLGDFVPTYVNLIEENNKLLKGYLAQIQLPEGLQLVIKSKISALEQQILKVVGETLETLFYFITQILEFFLAPIVAFYLLKDKESLERNFLRIIPQNIKIHLLSVLRDIDNVVISFVKGHLLVCGCVGILTSISMFLIGIPFGGLIGIFAGIADLVPFFGPFIGATPAILLAMIQSTRQVFLVVIAVVIIQQIESNVISPKILGDSLGLHPITIIFSLLAAGQLFGIWGLLLAVPMTGIIKVTARYIFLKLVG